MNKFFFVCTLLICYPCRTMDDNSKLNDIELRQQNSLIERYMGGQIHLDDENRELLIFSDYADGTVFYEATIDEIQKLINEAYAKGPQKILLLRRVEKICGARNISSSIKQKLFANIPKVMTEEEKREIQLLRLYNFEKHTDLQSNDKEFKKNRQKLQAAIAARRPCDLIDASQSRCYLPDRLSFDITLQTHINELNNFFTEKKIDEDTNIDQE